MGIDGGGPMWRVSTPAILFLSTVPLWFTSALHAAVPQGFSWVNLETDKTTMALVRRSVHDNSVTAIREVGVQDGFALVMAVSREQGDPTPDYDRWSIYSLVLATGKTRLLLTGYGVKIHDWIGPSGEELAITYYDCWECEPATLFTTLRLVKGSGWVARWPDERRDAESPKPGALVLTSDVGEPYDDTEAQQVFAVVARPSTGFAAGYWLHTKEIKTGKLDDDVLRYSVDPSTGKDRVESLKGLAALKWKRQICGRSDVLPQLGFGQDSKACRSVLRTAQVSKAISQ